jgi:hypothetical protein
MDQDLMIIRQTGGARAPKRAAWERVLERWRGSGLGVTEFGRQHGIKTKLLFKWRAKLQPGPTPAGAGSFAELEVSPGCPSIEIHLGLARVLLPFDGNGQRLAMILQAVREAAC